MIEITTAPPPTETGDDELPFVSVLIPMRNEAGYISTCLQALAMQDYPRGRFEVIVLDGESTDSSAHEAEEAAQILGVPDVFLTNQGQTTAKGLNLGLALSQGSVIIRVDGHTRVEPSFISASVEALDRSGADAVGGPIETAGYGRTGEAIALALGSRFGIGGAAFRYGGGERWVDTVAFAAYKRDVFERCGRFAEDIDKGEDDEFNYRLIEAGGRILLTPSIRSTYFCRSSFGALWRQYLAFGKAKAMVFDRHPDRMRGHHVVPSAFVVALAGTTALGLLDRRFRRLGFLVGGAYAAVNLGASFSLAARRNRWRSLPLLPAAFTTIHIAAGVGLLAGWLGRLIDAHRR